MELIEAIPERLIGGGIEMGIPSRVKLTEVCPALAATSLGLAPAAIHKATAV
jgi:hypothetical protein